MTQLGPLYFRSYGLIISIAIIVSTIFGYFEAKKQNKNINIYLNLVLLSISGGIIGARIYHIIHRWSFYRQNLYLIPNVWQGGLGIYGAVAGALLLVYIYAKVKKVILTPWLDIAGLILPLGQAIGRWANFVTQELYGYPTNLPWGIYIDVNKRLPEFNQYSRFHPLFLYESMWNLITFITLLIINHRYKKYLLKGELFILYLCLYSTGRFFIEFLKPNVWILSNIPVAQIISFSIIVFCIIYVKKLHNKKSS